MGGVACWKQIIDMFNILFGLLNCMAETIRIAGFQKGEKINLDYSDVESFKKHTDAMAKEAERIRKKVSEGNDDY